MMYRIEKINNADIVQFVRFEEILNDFLSALTTTNTAQNNLLSKKMIEFPEDDKDLIEDMSLGTVQLIEATKNNLKNIVNIREAYTTIVSQDLNRVIKLLTALTIILNVPVLVASLYGMNVALPGAHSPLAFWWLFGGTSILTIILLLLFMKNKWLG